MLTPSDFADIICEWSLSWGEDVFGDFETVFAVGIPVTWLIVLLDFFFSSELEYMQNMDDVTGTDEFLKKLRGSEGVVTFHAKCYHWETRTREGGYLTAAI